MVGKKFIFIGGFLQEDINALKNVLKQNPNIYVLQEGAFLNLINACFEKFNDKNPLLIIDIARLEFLKFLSGIKQDYIVDFNYNIYDFKVIENIINVLSEVPEFIFLLRPVHECISINFKNSKINNIEEYFLKGSFKEQLKLSYINIKTISELYKDKVLLLDINDLKEDSFLFLKKLNFPDYNYNLNDIGLESKINLLGDNTCSYIQENYWNKNSDSSFTMCDELDVSLTYALRGKHDISEKKTDEFLKKYPGNYRGLFNKGWTEMMKGNLLKGHEYYFYGRYEGAYGNKPPLNLPFWNGEENKTVLFYLEGGLGDQIHFVRFVKQIRAKNCKVITCCDKSLINLFKFVDGIDVIIDVSEINHYNYDCYIPSMSCIIPLKLEYKNISDEPYIFLTKNNKTAKNDVPVIGLRWRGNPNFEHEQYRLFPSEYLFNAVSRLSANFISLQKDIGQEETPNWVRKVNLNTWIDTAMAILHCDFVVTSCTSVAHLAAAMGIKTYIIIPILPYFIWALPGEKSVFYKNVRLFRQTQYNSWVEPFKKLNETLEYETRYYTSNT